MPRLSRLRVIFMKIFLAVERRQVVAHGANRGNKRKRVPAPAGRKTLGEWMVFFCRPSGVGKSQRVQPTACAVGYYLPPLRGCQTRFDGEAEHGEPPGQFPVAPLKSTPCLSQ